MTKHKNSKGDSMKKKTIIIASIVIVLIIALSSLLIYKNKVNKDYDKLTETIGIKKIEKIDYKLPKFSILVSGIYDNTITDVDCKDLDVYSFQAIMDDGIYKQAHKYIGIKVNDVLKMAYMDSFNKLTFMSSGFLQVAYSREEITDNVYLVFSVDGHEYEGPEPMALLNPDVNARYSVTGIVKFLFD
jgi:hypothetical protein